MQAMKMKRLVPTYVLMAALAVGAASGGLIAASAFYVADQSPDSVSRITVDSVARPVFHRPMDERTLSSSDGTDPAGAIHARDRADELSTLNGDLPK